MSGELHNPSEDDLRLQHDQVVEQWKTRRREELTRIEKTSGAPRVEYADFYSNPSCIPTATATEIMKTFYTKGMKGDGRLANGVINPPTRKVDTYYLEHFDTHRLLENVFADANSQPFFNFECGGIETAHMVVYHGVDNAHYTWHVDAINSLEYRRVMSTSILLNSASEFEGGELQLFMGIDGDGKPNVVDAPLKNAGDMVVFKSDVIHRVKPVTKGTRVCLVTWMWGEYGNKQFSR